MQERGKFGLGEAFSQFVTQAGK
jgi:hypothetical protein